MRGREKSSFWKSACGFSSTIKHSWSHPRLPISSRVHFVRLGSSGFFVVGGWVVLNPADLDPLQTPHVILQTFAINLIEQSTSGAKENQLKFGTLDPIKNKTLAILRVFWVIGTRRNCFRCFWWLGYWFYCHWTFRCCHLLRWVHKLILVR